MIIFSVFEKAEIHFEDWSDHFQFIRQLVDVFGEEWDRKTCWEEIQESSFECVCVSE